MSWWNNHKCRNYADLVALWQTCRNKEKGKPLNTEHRLLLAGDKFTITYTGHPIAYITPDNIVEVVSDALSIALYKTLPILVMRYGTGKYRIDHTSRVTLRPVQNPVYGEKYDYWLDFNEFRSEAHPQYFAGIKFNLLTGECVNRLPDLKHHVIPEVALQWKRDIIAWRKGWEVRQRLGVVDAYAKSLVNDPDAQRIFNELLREDRDQCLASIVQRIKAQDFSLEAYVYILCISGWAAFGASVQPRLVHILNSYRDKLRKIYGVFG